MIKKDAITNMDYCSTDIVNFDDYCQALGITAEDFQNLDENVYKIISGVQKGLTLLLLKNMAIVDKRLSSHLLDEDLYPTKQIGGMRLLFEMMSSATALQKIVDENQAIRTLESLGYSIKKADTLDV